MLIRVGRKDRQVDWSGHCCGGGGPEPREHLVRMARGGWIQETRK